MKEKIKEFLLYVVFTFIKPVEEMFYDGTPGSAEFKENYDELERWSYYHDHRGRSIRQYIKAVIAVVIFCLLVLYIGSCVAECSRYITKRNSEKNNLAKKFNLDSKHVCVGLVLDQIEFLEKNKKKIYVVPDVVKDYPIILTEQIIDGCEYLVCFTDSTRGNRIVTVIHKGNCKSPAHKK